jgi:hypothetical protein
MVAPSLPRLSDGRIVHGLAQTAAVWLAMMFFAWLIRHPATPWVCIGIGLLAGLLLGVWHRRHGRRDSAVGAYTGAAAWPLLIGAALIMINAASMMMYDFE